MPPLLILAVGIAIVLGLILVLRVNAFLALLTAAIAVSLLAPGETASKISRVAEAFGEATGKVGIVIALAAVIGQCMMDSGAADRVVRAFLRVLGIKRSPWALLGSGYILAIPVFFDTVFYLLVPLARSFYKRTGGQYLRCLLAIAAGGAVTHTLVPPTPGPLTIAANLNIDLGVMMGVGALVALPSAIAGLLFGSLMDRLMPVPMRPLADRTDPEPLPDDQLPSLWLSLLPVALPVLLIGASTALGTLADAEGAALLRPGDVTDWTQEPFHVALGPQDTPAAREAALKRLNGNLSDRDAVTVFGLETVSRTFGWPSSQRIPERLNRTTDPAERDRLERLRLLWQLLDKPPTALAPAQVQRRNRLYLELIAPDAVRPYVWETPLRQSANVAALVGNPNFALLLSTVVALGLWISKRRPTRDNVARQVELALMSGGVIILITAAGMAFGAMLQAARVGPAIEALFSDTAAAGYVWLAVGFALAAVLKVAQGSSTAAMIIGSSMLAPTVAGGNLPYHAVYLATAIGSGSLVGSWMNDSGFWVFTKLSGLTETEGLKTWTPLLVVLGVTGFATTLLLAMLMPLV